MSNPRPANMKKIKRKRFFMKSIMGIVTVSLILTLFSSVLVAQEKGAEFEINKLNQEIHALSQQKRFKQAVVLAEKALVIAEKSADSTPTLVAFSLSLLAALQERLENYSVAEALHNRALSLREKSLGVDSLEVASSLNRLAIIHNRWGDYNKALSIYERSLAIREKVLGPDSADVASTLNFIAGIYGKLGKQPEKEESLRKRSLAIREKVLDPSDRYIGQSLANLAYFYELQKNYDKADIFYYKTLVFWATLYGPDSSLVAATLKGMARVYRSTHNIDDGIRYEQRADKINLAVIDGLKIKARELRSSGNIEEARRIESIAEKVND